MSSSLGSITRSTPSPAAHATATPHRQNSPANTASATAATEADQTGYAARTARYGPLVGAVLGTTDLVSTAADATYDLATTKLKQLGSGIESAVTQAEHTLSDLGTAAGHALTSTESALEKGSEQVSIVAKSLTSAVETGARKLGQWIDEAA